MAESSAVRMEEMAAEREKSASVDIDPQSSSSAVMGTFDSLKWQLVGDLLAAQFGKVARAVWLLSAATAEQCFAPVGMLSASVA